MSRNTTHKKIIILIVVFFGEILISLSDKAITMGPDSATSEQAISRKLDNQVSSYQSVMQPEGSISNFLDEWSIAGASLAIMKNERLIYAKGFGYADKTTSEEVQPRHLFRVASISKLITSVAIMKLVEKDQLSLKQKVFGENGILKDSTYYSIKDERVKNITIYHLLTHSAGWAKTSGDPVFMPYTIKEKMDVDLPVDLETTIQYTLQHKSLDFDPGSRSSYSNFGYAVLGKVIEKVTGIGYEDYVTSTILHPLNIYDMHVGSAQESDRLPNEVTYYSNSPFKNVYSSLSENKIVPRQYGGNNFQVLEAAGAWVASPAELMKLLAHIDGNPEKEDILKQETIQQMVRTKQGLKPIGWIHSSVNGPWIRTGTLTGTSAILKKGENDFSWIMILNTSNKMRHDFTNHMDSVVTRFINEVKVWPDYDLFNYSRPTPLYTHNNDF